MSIYDPSFLVPYPNGTYDTDDGDPEQASAAADPQGATQLHEQCKDVLVVDDDLYLSEIIADVLEAEGHIARQASNGVEALEQIRKSKPQLILLDLMMPVMNGWELADVLRGNPEWADIPVVIITANYHADRKQQVLGARAVITKPFDIDRLVQVVEEFAQ
jgi:CheY-like chemotaxis protein